MFKWFQARPPSRGKTVPILRTRKFEGGPWEDDASSAPENPRSPTGTSWLEKNPTVLDRHVGRRCRLPDHAGQVALWRCLQTLLHGLPHGPDLVLRSRQGVCHWAPGEAHRCSGPHRPTEMSVLRAAWGTSACRGPAAEGRHARAQPGRHGEGENAGAAGVGGGESQRKLQDAVRVLVRRLSEARVD